MSFKCTKCGIEKDISDFHKRSMVTRGHDSWCKSCKSEYRKDYFTRNTEKERKRGRIKAWKAQGISISFEEYESLKFAQGSKCLICKDQFQEFHVDHCHVSGKVRGLLCGPCNQGLGQFKDNVSLLKAAINYLENNND